MENINISKSLLQNSAKASRLLSAMANEKRLQILCNLIAKEMSVGELANAVELSQSALSQHLAKLRALDIIAPRRDAQTIYYKIASSQVAPIITILENVFGIETKEAFPIHLAVPDTVAVVDTPIIYTNE